VGDEEVTENRVELARKPVQCPECTGRPVATIMYGLPDFTDELEQKLQSGKTVLGGCCITNDDPQWKCTCCGLNIYRKQT